VWCRIFGLRTLTLGTWIFYLIFFTRLVCSRVDYIAGEDGTYTAIRLTLSDGFRQKEVIAQLRILQALKYTTAGTAAPARFQEHYTTGR